jgi:hypothetical protein
VQALDALKARGVWVVGYDAAGTERWDAVDLARPVALVLGGEGRGIRRLVREHCDHLVSIPHFGHVGSLNVSVAAGIALYEAVRQRRAVPSGVRPIPAKAATPRIVGPAPGDEESDPGARPGPPFHEPEDATDADEAALPVTHVDPHEDVAWGQGPTVLKPVGFERVRRPNDRRGRGRRRPGQGRPPGERAPVPPPSPGSPEPQAARRKGRRRRKGRDGLPPGPPRPESDTRGGSPAPGETGGEQRPAGEVPGDRTPGGRRHRRRRRRR